MSNTAKKWVVAVLIVAVIAIITVSAKHSESKNEVRIGATLALSGNLGYLGEEEQRGLQMGIDDVNAKGGVFGKKLALIAEDNQGDPKMAVSSAQKFTSVDKVNFLFSAFSAITQQVAPIATQAGTPMIYHASDASFAEGSTLFFRDYFDARDNGKAIADEAGALGYKKVSFISEINSGCTQLETALKTEAASLGIEVVDTETYQGTATDLRTQLTKLKQVGTPITTCSFRHSNIIATEMEELGMLDIPVIYYVAPFLPAADTAAVRAIYEKDHAVSTWYKNLAIGSQAEKDFADAYAKKYGGTPRPDSAYAYDDVHILARAMNECGSAETSCVLAHMKNSSYDGASGHVSFNDKGVSSRPVSMIKVVNGEWQAMQ